MKTDPICHMKVDEATALTTEWKGERVYFCSEGCKDRFLDQEAANLTRSEYDVVIIGAGPAGLTAAVYAATLKMDAFLLGKEVGGQAIDSRKIENYMGFDFITGPELMRKYEEQLIHSHYVDHVISEVNRIEGVEGGFRVTSAELQQVTGKTLIIATGMTRRTLDVPGEERLQRRGIFYGNVQDLSFVQGKAVVVVGGGNSALQMVESLDRIATSIAVISDVELTGDPSIVARVRAQARVTLYEGYKVAAFHGERRLEGITMRRIAAHEERRLPIDGAFIAIGLQPNTGLVRGLVDLNDRGEICIDPDCSTTHSGIFAAGDCTDAFGKRIIIAAGEGAKAALAARQYLLERRRAQRRAVTADHKEA
jgi:alkyl hydroperoxide reductase subunit F